MMVTRFTEIYYFSSYSNSSLQECQEPSTNCRWQLEYAAEILADFSKTYHHLFLLKPYNTEVSCDFIYKLLNILKSKEFSVFSNNRPQLNLKVKIGGY